MNSNQI